MISLVSYSQMISLLPFTQEPPAIASMIDYEVSFGISLTFQWNREFIEHLHSSMKVYHKLNSLAILDKQFPFPAIAGMIESACKVFIVIFLAKLKLRALFS